MLFENRLHSEIRFDNIQKNVISIWFKGDKFNFFVIILFKITMLIRKERISSGRLLILNKISVTNVFLKSFTLQE